MESLINLFRKVRLISYRYQFCGLGRKFRDISVQEACAADVIRLMGYPTVSEFAAFFGISQPNATYKVKNLVSKGYLKKFTSKKDRRECRLSVEEKFETLRKESDAHLSKALDRLEKQFSPEELETALRVLNAAYELISQEEDHERSV